MGPGSRLKAAAPLLFVLVLALVVRVAWMQSRALVIENEGGEYATLAEHLLAGKGYVGLGMTGKPQLLFPPLYAFLIAAVTPLAGDSELAGRLVSIAAGVVLVAALSGLARRLYGPAAGFVAGILASLHPLLVSLSTAVYTESTYFALIFLGIVRAMDAVESGRLRDYAIAGALFGLAYLTRPEAILYVAILVAVALGRAAFVRPRRWPLRGLGAALGAFAVMAAPYVGFLWAHTGRLLLEGKTASNFEIGQRMRAGQPEWYAYYGVDDELREVGVYMGDVNRHLRAATTRATLAETVSYIVASAGRQGRIMLGAMKAPIFGGLGVFGLALLGLLRAAHSRARLDGQAFLLLAATGVIVATFSLQFYYVRYSYVLLPFLLAWAAGGASTVGQALSGWMGRARAEGGASRPVLEAAIGSFLAVLVAVTAMRAPEFRAGDEFGNSPQGARLTKAAGLWLRDQPPADKIVMDVGTAIPYYGRGEMWMMPYASSATALRYIDAKKPDYVVLRGIVASHRPFLEDWLEKGIPSDRLRLVHTEGESGAERVQIYGWER